MNYIDFFLIIFVVVAMALGLLGKVWRKVITLIMIIISIPCSYGIAKALTDTYAEKPVSEISFLKDDSDTPLEEWIVAKAKSNEFVDTLYNNSPAFASVMDNTPKVVVKLTLFYFIGLIDFLIFSILGFIVYQIVKLFMGKKEKKKGAIWLFGIPSGITALIIGLFIISPLFLVKPVISDVVNLYSQTENKSEKVEANLKKLSSQTEGSKVCIKAEEYLNKKEATWLCYTVDGKTYYVYDELEDLGDVVSEALPIYNSGKAMISDASSIDYTDANSISTMVGFLDSLETMLTEVDTLRGGLEDDSHVKEMLNDLLKYYVDKYPETLDESSPFYFLNRADLTNFDFENDSLKDKLFPIILQSFIDELASDKYGYTFLSSLDVSTMTFTEIKAVLSDIANIVDLYLSIKTDDISSLSKEDIVKLISSIDNNETVKGILTDTLTDLGVSGVDLSNIDLSAEAETIGTIIELTKATDTSSIDSAELASSLADSELIYAIIDNSDSLSVSVTTEQKDSISSTLQAKVDSSDISVEEYNQLLGIFNIG